LAKSYNQAAARIGRDVGLPAISANLARFDVELAEPVYPSMILGSVTLTPMQIAQMYQVIAAGGFYSSLNSVRVVVSDTGALLTHKPFLLEERFSPAVMALLQYTLNRVTVEGSGRSLSRTVPGIALAGKTGTTDDQRDSWFAGFSGDYAAVVWVGHDDNSPTRFTGASGALRIWSTLMKPLATESVAMPETEELVYMGYDHAAATLYKEGCDGGVLVPFLAQSAPRHTASCVNRSTLQSLKDKIFEWFSN